MTNLFNDICCTTAAILGSTSSRMWQSTEIDSSLFRGPGTCAMLPCNTALNENAYDFYPDE